MSKCIAVTVWKQAIKYQIEGRAGDKMFTALLPLHPDFAGCGGKGICGRCRIRYRSAAPLPSHADRQYFTPKQLREGWRLACTARLVQDCQIESHYTGTQRMDIVTQEQQDSQLGFAQKSYVAMDIGTTTVAMQLVGQTDQCVLDTYCFVNPQRRYGRDVLARIQADAEGHGADMCQLLLEKMQEGLRVFRRKQAAHHAPEPFAYLVIAGNTAMLHILQGYALKGLGREPFYPVDIQEQNRMICGVPARILPGCSAFVGADITAGLYACDMVRKEEISLLIDLGTNGELVLGNRHRLLATATAAGPAFEGGAAGVHGADLIGLVVRLLEQGMLDDTGLLQEPYFTEGVMHGEALIQQADIRALQMAKAAVYAGIGILCSTYGIRLEGVEHVYLAGGFGYYLKPEEAIAIGLLPKAFAGKIQVVGNSALKGAIRYGSSISGSWMEEPAKQGSLQQIVGRMEVLNLAKQDSFEERYLAAMNLQRG